MTDIRALRDHSNVVDQNVRLFLGEMNDLQAPAPLILAFGRDTYRLLNEHLKNEAYRKLIGITHYSHHQMARSDTRIGCAPRAVVRE